MFHKYRKRPDIGIYVYECHTPISIEKGNVGGITKQYDECSVAKNGCEKSGAEKNSGMKYFEGDGSSANPMGMANEGDCSGDGSDVIKLIAGGDNEGMEEECEEEIPPEHEEEIPPEHDEDHNIPGFNSVEEDMPTSDPTCSTNPMCRDHNIESNSQNVSDWVKGRHRVKVNGRDKGRGRGPGGTYN